MGPNPGNQPKIELIVAQGRVAPWGGVVNVPVAPGQRVESLLVAEGDNVVAGQTELAKMTGTDLLDLQVQMAAARRSDAELEIEQKIVTAEIGLRSAEAARDTARLNLDQVRARKDQEIAAKQIESARQKLERMRQLAGDPQTANLISQQELEDQALLLEKAQYETQLGEIQMRQASQTAELALQNAEMNVESARKSLELARQLRSGNKSLVLAETIAKTQLDNSRIIAPIDGTVLRIFVKPGEAAVNTPLLQIGNVARMECIAEVNDRIARQVRAGQHATIKSPALPRDLNGIVRHISRMVGNSTLPNPSPLAMVDIKTVDVHIEIDPADVAVASSVVNLQATVEIDPGTTPADSESSVARSTSSR
jgi:HlyD family secretion protein